MTPGTWVIVCGPSGAGKDSVIGWAAQALAGERRIVFARRMVTRAAQPGSDHDEVSLATLQRRRAAGELAWHWEAHGLHYGVDGGYASEVAAGHVVVVNGSRAHAATLAPRPDLRLVRVTAPAGVLGTRLHERQREPAEAVARRLARNEHLDAVRADLEICNDNGELPAAGSRLAAYLKELAA